MSSGTEFLKKVSTKINEKIREVEQEIEQGRQEIQDMNDYYWDNYTEMDQYGYENYDNQQALLHQVNANQEQQKMYRRLRRMQDSPFFARVDFQYEGEDAPELFYIGIGNFAEKAGMIPLIYDWRAPVSGLFYDYDCGPASYEAPGGTMEGEICSKWQYKIRRGRMVSTTPSPFPSSRTSTRSPTRGETPSLRNLPRARQVRTAAPVFT